MCAVNKASLCRRHEFISPSCLCAKCNEFLRDACVYASVIVIYEKCRGEIQDKHLLTHEITMMNSSLLQFRVVPPVVADDDGFDGSRRIGQGTLRTVIIGGGAGVDGAGGSVHAVAQHRYDHIAVLARLMAVIGAIRVYQRCRIDHIRIWYRLILCVLLGLIVVRRW